MTCLPGINDHKSKASSYVFGNAIHFSSHSLFRVLYLFLLLRLPTPLFFPYAQLIIWLMILPRRENHWEMVSLSFHQIWLMCLCSFLKPALSSVVILSHPLGAPCSYPFPFLYHSFSLFMDNSNRHTSILSQLFFQNTLIGYHFPLQLKLIPLPSWKMPLKCVYTHFFLFVISLISFNEIFTVSLHWKHSCKVINNLHTVKINHQFSDAQQNLT